MEAKVRKGKLIQKLILVSIAAIIGISIILTVISSYEITNTYNDMIKEELQIGAEHLQSEMNSVWDGDWSYVDGDIYKGEQNIMEEYQELMDELHEKTGIEYSLFYEDNCVLTTIFNGNTRLTGYKCSADTKEHVLNTKTEYYSSKANIAGTDERYYIYYAPMLQSDGSVAGMVFAGRSVHDVEARINKILITMIAIASVLVIILSIAGYIVASKTSVKMRAIADELDLLSQGTCS